MCVFVISKLTAHAPLLSRLYIRMYMNTEAAQNSIYYLEQLSMAASSRLTLPMSLPSLYIAPPTIHRHVAAGAATQHAARATQHAVRRRWGLAAAAARRRRRRQATACPRADPEAVGAAANRRR